MLKLSEAILATTRPQYYGGWAGRVRGKRAVCAMAGAFEAAGLVSLHWMFPLVSFNIIQATLQANLIWPVLEMRRTCPVGCGTAQQIDYLCIHLSDYHRWSRQRISQWVALCEEAIEPPKAIPLSREDAEMWRELTGTNEAEDETEVAGVPSH